MPKKTVTLPPMTPKDTYDTRVRTLRTILKALGCTRDKNVVEEITGNEHYVYKPHASLRENERMDVVYFTLYTKYDPHAPQTLLAQNYPQGGQPGQELSWYFNIVSPQAFMSYLMYAMYNHGRNKGIIALRKI